MADKVKKSEETKEKVKTKRFFLKKPHLGKTIGESVEVGPKGEQDLKFKGII